MGGLDRGAEISPTGSSKITPLPEVIDTSLVSSGPLWKLLGQGKPVLPTSDVSAYAAVKLSQHQVLPLGGEWQKMFPHHIIFNDTPTGVITSLEQALRSNLPFPLVHLNAGDREFHRFTDRAAKAYGKGQAVLMVIDDLRRLDRTNLNWLQMRLGGNGFLVVDGDVGDYPPQKSLVGGLRKREKPLASILHPPDLVVASRELKHPVHPLGEENVITLRQLPPEHGSRTVIFGRPEYLDLLRNRR